MQLILTPFFLRRLGGENFGVWMFALTIVAMSPLVSLGASVAATKHVSADLGRGLRDQAVAAIRGALAVATVGGVIAAALMALLAPVLAGHLLHNLGTPARVAPVLALCGLAAVAQEIDNVFAGAMRGAERFDLCAKVEVPARIVIGGALAWCCVLSASVHLMLASYIILLSLKAALKGRQVARLFGTGTCCLPSLAAEPLRRVVSFGAWQWLQTAGTVFFSAADQLLIGGLIGAAALARYSACLQIAQYVHTLPSVMTQVIFPRLSALGPDIGAARGNDILRSATLVTVATAGLLGLPLMILASPVLRLWIGALFAQENHWLLTVLVAVHIVLAFNIASYFVLLGSGRAARSAVIVIAAGAAQFAAAFAAAPFGIFAVACSRFVYAFLTALLYKAAAIAMKVEMPRCRLCGEGNVESLGTIPDSDFFAGRVLTTPMPGGRLLRCPGCESMFRHPIQSAKSYLDLYARGAPEQWHGGGRRYDLAILSSVIGAAPGRRTVLDLGCGTGDFLMSLPADVAKFGIEPSTAAAAEARRRGVTILAAVLEGLPPHHRFDFITIIDVIEHVPVPAQLLDLAYARLLPGGCLMVATGDPRSAPWLRVFRARFWYVGFPEHISFPSLGFFQKWQLQTDGQVPSMVRTRYQRLSKLLFGTYLLGQLVYFVSPLLLNLIGQALQFVRRTHRPRRRWFIPGAPGVFIDHQVVTIRRPT